MGVNSELAGGIGLLGTAALTGLTIGAAKQIMPSGKKTRKRKAVA